MALTTGKVRLSFCHVWEPHASQTGSEPKYSTVILIPKNDISTLNAIYTEMEAVKQSGISTVWGGMLPPIVKTTLNDGDGVRPSSGEPYGPECRGHMVLTASSKTQPQIVDLNVQPILTRSEVYSGCYARVNINFFAYSQSGNKGLGCGLNCIQKVEHGQPLAGGVSAQEAFGGANAYTGPGIPPAVQGAYQTPVQPAYPAQQPGYPQPPVQTFQPQYAPAPAPYTYPAGIDPITGKPMMPGGVMGI